MSDAAPVVDLAAVRRGWWLAGARSLDHALVFVAQVLVARWIGPDDFGAFAVALLVLTIMDGATESGIAAALVHRDDVQRKQLDVSWSLTLLRGIALSAVMLVAAPLIATLADAPDSAPLIRWMAVVPLVRALTSPALVSLERALRYRQLAVCSLVESVAMFSATLALVPFVDGAGPLVGGIIAGEIARVIASYVLAPHAPRLHFDAAVTRDLLRYGRWVTGSSIALLLLLYMDDVAVAALLGGGALAVYQLAYMVAGVPVSEISLVVGQIAFTSMSRLRAEPARLARAFLESYELVAALAIPIGVALAVMADPLVAVLLGPRWSAAVPVIQVLAAWGVLRALGALTTALFRAVGRPDIPARHHWRMVLVTAVFLVPMIEIGDLVGAAIAVLVPNLVIHWRRYRDVASVLEIGVGRIVGRLLVPLGSGFAMAVVMSGILVSTAALWPGWTLVAGGVGGALTYLLVMGLLERSGRGHALHSVRLLTRGAR